MTKSEQIKALLHKSTSDENQHDTIAAIDSIITSESNNYNTFSKLIYDIFLEMLTDYKNTNYSYSAYKSWFFHFDTLELFWDGRDEYLFLWDTTDGNKKTLKVTEANNINFKIIAEFRDLIAIHKLVPDKA